MIQVKKNEATAALRRMEFHCVDATDGITPETGEAGGQPQISLAGAAWGNTAGVLVAIGNGRYYVELTQAETDQADRTVIYGRYKSANTAEALGTTIQIAEFPVDASMAAVGVKADRLLGLSLENAVEDTFVFDTNGMPVSSVITCYDSAANATTHDGVTGLVAKYNVTATHVNKLPTLMKVIKQ
jgi:hypothetical protein